MSDVAPTTPVIMVIRHGEKPVSNPPIIGITTAGIADPASLIVRGWQRAGALACLFAPSHGSLQNSNLARPKQIFVGYGKCSNRPAETASVLAAKLNITEKCFDKSEWKHMVDHYAMAQTEPLLISWEHGEIPELAARIPLVIGGPIPTKWPSECFDMVWVFTLNSTEAAYDFKLIPQNLLPGDSPTRIPPVGESGD